jgi:hypothetical protein
MQEGDADSVRAGDMGALATLGSFAPQKRKEKYVHLDDVALYQETPGTRP